jgi:hypothetical protein
MFLALRPVCFWALILQARQKQAADVAMRK